MAKAKKIGVFSGFEKRWEKAKRAVDPLSVGVPEGTYVAQLVATGYGNLASDGSPYVRFNFVIRRGEYQGVPLSRLTVLADRKNSQGQVVRTEDEQYETLAIDLQRLGVDTSSIESERDLVNALDGLAERKPLVQLRVRPWASGEGMNVYINRLVEVEEDEDEEESSEDEDRVDATSNNRLRSSILFDDDEEDESESETVAEEEDEEEENEEDEEDEEDEEEENEEDEEEPEEEESEETVEASEEPEEGDVVRWKPHNKRKEREFIVQEVDEGEQTVTLVSEDGSETYEQVPWAELTFVYE